MPEAFARMQALAGERNRLATDDREKTRREEYVRFQLTEIERAYESVEQIQNGTPVSERSLIEVSDPSFILTFRGTF